MNRKFFLLLILYVISNYSYAQTDTKTILDKVASVHNGYKTIQADFKITTTTPGNQPRTETGKVLLKNDKYHLIMPNMDIIYDGKSIYTYLPKAKEINITNPEPAKVEKGDFFFSNPRDIFKGYNKNFKSTFSKENNKNNVSYFDIDLFPIDRKTKYSRVRMHVQKQSYHIDNLIIFQKDGTQYLLEFENFTPNKEISDKEFVFDTKNYPGVEVNDMRF